MKNNIWGFEEGVYVENLAPGVARLIPVPGGHRLQNFQTGVSGFIVSVPDAERRSGRVPPPAGKPPEKRKRGRPRKVDPKVSAKLELAVAMWGEVRKPRETGRCGNAKCSSSTLAGGKDLDEEMDFASSWGNQKNPAMGELGEHGEVIELHYGMVSSNEYSERDGPWLFHPDNPDREGWLEANTLEELKVITDDTLGGEMSTDAAYVGDVCNVLGPTYTASVDISTCKMSAICGRMS